MRNHLDLRAFRSKLTCFAGGDVRRFCDYLEWGLSAFDISCEEVELGRL